MKKNLIVLIGLFAIACNNTNNAETANDLNETEGNTAITAPIALNYTIQKVYPHDTTAYTQG
jgi:glutamine cyclotransferase